MSIELYRDTAPVPAPGEPMRDYAHRLQQVWEQVHAVDLDGEHCRIYAQASSYNLDVLAIEREHHAAPLV